MGHGMVIHRRLVFRVQYVIRCISGLKVRAVFQQVAPHDIAQGPDAWNVGLEILVGIDVAALVEFHAGVGHLKNVFIGDAAGGHEQGVLRDRPLAVGRGGFDRNLPALGGYPFDLGVQDHVEAALVDLGAKCAEEMGQFSRDIAAADHR